MIGLALSGGGSRAIAFHLGCLRALNDMKVLDRISVLSAISGGAVIGAYYAYSPHKTFEAFDNDVRELLRVGFQKAFIVEMIKPGVLVALGRSWIGENMEVLWSALTNDRELAPTETERFCRTDVLVRVLDRRLFKGLRVDAKTRNDIDVVIGSCDLRTGSAFRFSNRCSGGWRLGILAEPSIDLAFAVGASAAYPLFLPPLDRTWNFRRDTAETLRRVLLTDGGIYDNLGFQVLEPDRSAAYSLHTYQCDYLLVCSAGHGMESGMATPTGFVSRTSKSFDIVHRRVQDSAMRRLHHLRETGSIRGFAMPYLGQQDHALPYEPADLVRRSEVYGYPTDFAAMSNAWISRLSTRGEQLTRLLVSRYVPELCG